MLRYLITHYQIPDYLLLLFTVFVIMLGLKLSVNLTYLIFQKMIHDPKAKLSFVGLLAICMVGFYVIYDLTIPPSKISGNGNLGLLFMVPMSIIFLVLNVFLGFKSYHFMKSQKKPVVTLFIMAMGSYASRSITRGICIY